MKILIVDDNPRRYERLVASLSQIGVGRSSVEIVTSAFEARNKMDVCAYDVLIVDILIPLWPERESSAQNSLDLVFEIREGGLKYPPMHILGITANRADADGVLAQFEEWTWTVLDYADDNDDWVKRATNCIEYLRNKVPATDDRKTERVDVAIVCALQSPELEEILRIPWSWSAARPIDDLVFVRDGIVESEGVRLSVCATSAPRMGMVATALHAAAVISKMRPRLVAMTGICAGVRGKVKVGDVLFVDPAWDFQSGKRIRERHGSHLAARPHQLPAPAKVRSHVALLRDDRDALAGLAARFPGETPGIPRIILGPVASGSAVLADGELISEIKQQHQDLIGVEMEAYGLYAAAHVAGSPQPACFALKSVCDFADPDKGDDHQMFAAYASAGVLQLLIERYGARLVE